MKKTATISFKVTPEQKDKALHIIQIQMKTTLQNYFENKLKELIRK